MLRTKPLIAIVALLVAARAAARVQYDIFKSFPGNEDAINLGKIVLDINDQYRQVYTSIEPNYPELVSSQDIQNSGSVLLEFIPTAASDPKYSSRIYRTSVTQIVNYPHDERISVIVGTEAQLLSFNYIQTRQNAGQIVSEAVNMIRSEAYIHVFQKEDANNKKGPQNESFFSKYVIELQSRNGHQQYLGSFCTYPRLQEEARQEKTDRELPLNDRSNKASYSKLNKGFPE